MILGTLFPSLESFESLDYPRSWFENAMGAMITIPESATNLTAIFLPLPRQMEVTWYLTQFT